MEQCRFSFPICESASIGAGREGGREGSVSASVLDVLQSGTRMSRRGLRMCANARALEAPPTVDLVVGLASRKKFVLAVRLLLLAGSGG